MHVVQHAQRHTQMPTYVRTDGRTYIHTYVGTVNDIMRTYVALINNNLSNRTTFSVICTLEWNESDTQHALHMALDKTLVCDGHGTKMENSVELMISYTMHRHTYGCTYESTQPYYLCSDHNMIPIKGHNLYSVLMQCPSRCGIMLH